MLAAGLICFVNLGAAGLWDLDEALYASIAREMGDRGDWVVPTYNLGVFYDKPPLMFWLMMGSFKVFGACEFAARLPAAILAVGTALATYHLARRLFSAEVGLWAGLAATSNVVFTVSARAATVDSALTFITTLAMALYAKGARIGEASSIQARSASEEWNRFPGLRFGLQSLSPANIISQVSNLPGTRQIGDLSEGRQVENLSYLAFRPASWTVYALLGVLLGLAVLAKGPVGFLLPAASLGLFLLVMNGPAAAPVSGGLARRISTRFVRVFSLFSPRQLLRTTWAMRPLTVLFFTALVALPWYVAIAWKTDGEWLRQFVTKYNLGPFVKPSLGHQGPFYYHFAVVLVGLFPWSVFLGPMIANAYRAIRARGKDLPSYVFLVCWIGVFFGFWLTCSTKLPHYVLPAYPALAILTACFLDAWVQRAEAAARYVMPLATGIFAGAGIAMLAVLPLVTARYAPGEQVVALLGLAPALGGAVSWRFLARQRRRSYVAAFAASSVLFITLLFGWAAVHIDRHQHSRPLLEEVRRDSPGEPQIAGYRYCDASTVYYAGGPVAECSSAAGLREFLDRSAHPYIVTTGDGWKDLDAGMPDRWRVVARRPRFLAKGEIVAVAPR